MIGTSALVVLVAAAASASLAAGSAAAPSLPRVTACGDAFAVRPSSILLGCGDGGQYLADVRWAMWSATGARGTATWAVNLCTPDCAAGHLHTERVTVTLSRPRLCRKPTIRLFTRMKLAGGHAPAVVARLPSVGPTRCP